jgi:hydrogenase maturation protein HypF
VDAAAARGARRVRLRVAGTVQGVGFRPFVFRLADELCLGGSVRNDSTGVTIELEGSAAALERFLARLRSEAPPLAAIESVASEDLEPTGKASFAIEESAVGGAVEAPVTADSATCSECVSELFDPANRRFRYPFINCTNCGPRFTIVRGVPYDRPLTTMAGFAMCERCLSEYEDPADRRFHAQPNACSDCGPSVSLVGRDARPVSTGAARDAVAACARALAEGLIVAVKGIGGFHLACRADDEEVVRRLRARKHRPDRPLALMVASCEQASTLVALDDRERALLVGRGCPIVLCRRLVDAPVAAAVAPGAPELGVMLPYSPLHHLLLADGGGPLVMTSGNVSDEPIAYEDADALGRLAGIADLLLLHDRPIATRTDDSVVRVIERNRARRPLLLRRSRGLVPGALALPQPASRPLLACGADLKSTFCVAKRERAWVSHHIGDLSTYETLRSFVEGIEHFEALFDVAPEVVAHDLHPGYLSTAYAVDREHVELVGVQHHHAHLAACLAEHGEEGPAVGAIFDGTGYGTDGTVWGGEILVGDTADFRRAGHLLPVRLPGGERAIREPWRMACAWLLAATGERVPDLPSTLAGRVEAGAWRAVAELSRAIPLSPITTSMGRLFDAVAALCGLRTHINYEGQAAIDLEAACDPFERGAYPLPVERGGATLVIDPRELISAIARDVRGGTAAGVIASRFHDAVASATISACSDAAYAEHLDLVVLSGGVFQNRRLLEAVAGTLEARGLRVLVPERLPPGDGGISYGQAVIAARRGARLERGPRAR